MNTLLTVNERKNYNSKFGFCRTKIKTSKTNHILILDMIWHSVTNNYNRQRILLGKGTLFFLENVTI